MAPETEEEVQLDRPEGMAAEVGPGSLKGKRWFVSYASAQIFVMRAHGGYDEDTGMPLNRKGKSLSFLAKRKPRHLWGRGFAGAENLDGDRNLGILWGVYATDNQKEIDFLRTREQYTKTTQDNNVDTNVRPLLKEFAFDPSPTVAVDTGKVVARSGKPAPAAPAAASGAPGDEHPDGGNKVKPGLRAPRAAKF